MSQFGSITLQSGVARAQAAQDARAARTPSRTAAQSAASAPPDPTADLPLTRHDLLELNANVGRSSHVANALTTAHDALSVIDGLLGNVKAVLTAASSPGDITFDRETDQSRIDSAVISIDAVATAARFGGRPLLDGTYQAVGPAGNLRLPSFISSQLGKEDANAPAIATLATRGPNDLTTGNLAPATQILATAANQVSGAQAAITRYLTAESPAPTTAPTVPAGVTPADLLTAAADQMFADPTLSAVAVANSSAPSVFALLRA